MKKDKKRWRGYGAIMLALALIVNPNINVIDILPDFIGYFILIRLISRAAESAPYFAEVKTMLGRLFWLSVLRMPAMIIVNIVRGENYTDNDIIALMTLVFTVAEVLLLIIAISNLFSALFYLGERTSTPALLSPFSISKNKTMKPEALRACAYGFVAIKCSANFLPETLLLTTSVEIGSQSYIQHMSGAYPRTLLISLLVSLAVGIVFLHLAKKYLISLGPDSVRTALDEISRDRLDEIAKTHKLKWLLSSLTATFGASFLAFELVFDNFKNINLLPSFLYGALLTYGLYRLAKSARSRRYTVSVLVIGSIFVATSVAAYVALIGFLDSYTYRDLVLGEVARADYIPVIIFAAAELFALLALLFVGALVNRIFVLNHTGIPTDSERYAKPDRTRHTQLIMHGYGVFAIGAALGVSKFLNVLFKYNAEVIFTNENDITQGIVITSSVPWFTVFVAAVAIIYICYSLYYLSTIKENVEIKYE